MEKNKFKRLVYLRKLDRVLDLRKTDQEELIELERELYLEHIKHYYEKHKNIRIRPINARES